MTRAPRPRRSILYVPGSNARALEKTKTLAADGFIFDLEDAVSPEMKEAARALACTALREGEKVGRERLIRVNALTTPWGNDDLIAAATSGADGVVLPKVDSGASVHDALAILDAHGAPRSMMIHCMLETPLGVLRAESIASSSPRIATFVMGTSDLARDLHAAHTPSRLPLLASLSLGVLAARAHGLAILDGVHLELADDVGFEAVCRQGKDLGFDGKTLIHPKTIDVANRVFAPSADEVAWSYAIISAYEAAEREGKALVVVDGRLVEKLHVEEAARTLALAASIAALEKA